MILHFYTITYIYAKIQTNLDKYLFKIFQKLVEHFRLETNRWNIIILRYN